MEDHDLLSFQPTENNTLEPLDENSDRAEVKVEENDYHIVGCFSRVFAVTQLVVPWLFLLPVIAFAVMHWLVLLHAVIVITF